MKICTKDMEEVQGLTYRDLKAGNVFTWINAPESVMLREDDGYVYLTESGAGLHYGEKTAHKADKVTRYPNACINLGDPE